MAKNEGLGANARQGLLRWGEDEEKELNLFTMEPSPILVGCPVSRIRVVMEQ